jgi:hypothetical protein
VVIAGRDGLIRDTRHTRGEAGFIYKQLLGRHGSDSFLLVGLAEPFANYVVQIGGHEERISALSVSHQPGVERLRVHVVAEGADGGLAPDGLTALHRRHECRLALGWTVVDDRPELASPPIGLDAVTVSEVVFHRQGVPKHERAGQWEAVAALLARERGRPQIAPWLLTVDYRVYVGHFVGVACIDLVQDEADVVEQTAVSSVQRVLLAERQPGLSGPVAERVIGEKLARERSYW